MSYLLHHNTQNKQCKSTLGGCVMKFPVPTLNSLQIFIEGIVNDPVHIMSILKSIPHIFEGGRYKFSHSGSYPTSLFQQHGQHWWNVNDALHVTPEEEIKGCKVSL
jgi:hypothetical protein